MVPLAGTLLEISEKERDPGRRLAVALLAQQAAPRDPRPHGFLAGLHLSSGFSPLTAFSQWLRWVRSVAGDPIAVSTGIARTLSALVVGAWFTALVLVLAGLATWGANLYHDYRDCFPVRFRKRTPPAFLLLTAVALWTAGVGPLVFLLLLGVALSPYLPALPRRALAVSLALGCVAPWALGAMGSVARPGGERAWALYRVWKGDEGPELEGAIRSLLRRDDPRAAFALARIQRRGGDLDAAARTLEDALGLAGAPRGLLHSELGTLRVLQDRRDEALSHFQRASREDPADPLPWLNQNLVLLDRLDLVAADQALEKARALGSAALERARSEVAQAGGATFPLSPGMPVEWVRDELTVAQDARAPWVDALGRALFLPAISATVPAFGLFALVGIFLGGRQALGRRSHRCPACGLVVCPRCSRRVKGSDLCPACWAAQREQEIDPAEKERVGALGVQWTARRERWRRIGNVLLPGWGGCLAGPRPTALLWGLLWSLSGGWLVLSGLYPAPSLPWGAAGAPWLAVLVLAVVHLNAARMALRRPKAEEG